jgi:hypothetical protein
MLEKCSPVKETSNFKLCVTSTILFETLGKHIFARVENTCMN